MDDWKKPGKTLQTAIASIIAEEPDRNAKGRFARKHTPSEIILKSLRASYETKPLLTADEISALLVPCEDVLYAEIKPDTSRPFFQRMGWRVPLGALGVVYIAMAMVIPVPLIQVPCALYGAANLIVAWEGK